MSCLAARLTAVLGALALGGCALPVVPEPAAVPAVAPDAPDRAAALLGGLTTPRQNGPYAPRDDCDRLPGASAFRHKLADAVVRGDAGALAAMASPEVKLGFAGDDGRDRFLARLMRPDDELMAEIARLLPLGCAVNAGGGLTMPWHFAQDMGDIDGFEATIVTGEEVPLRRAADATAPVLRRLSWDLVALDAGLYPERPYQQVRLADGTRGHVETRRLRSLLDYRLLVDREGGEWRITAILAGD